MKDQAGVGHVFTFFKITSYFNVINMYTVIDDVHTRQSHVQASQSRYYVQYQIIQNEKSHPFASKVKIFSTETIQHNKESRLSLSRNQQ